MNDTTAQIDLNRIRHLVPIAELNQESLQDLISKTKVETLAKGRALFKKGDEDNHSYYLLSGEVTLVNGTSPERTLAGNTHATRYPLDQNKPYQCTALAKTDVEFIRIDNDLLDILLTWNQNAGYMVTEIDSEVGGQSDADWMTSMLRSSIFHRIPPGNIQAVFMRMEPVRLSAGKTVIKQGDEGDYYYYIKQGRCMVTHNSAKSGKSIKLAELGAGSSFGEEALIAGTKRNADVTMLTDGVLMRLAKQDFEALLKEPVLRSVKFADAATKVKGGAVWLDVRLESEHSNSAIPGSINIPLYMLRIKSSSLDKNKTYVVYCDTGRRSSSATYLLNERGFDACCLEGGLIGLKREARQEAG